MRPAGDQRGELHYSPLETPNAKVFAASGEVLVLQALHTRRRAVYTLTMPDLPDKTAQILDVHTGLIHRVVIACHNRELVPDLDQILAVAESNDWIQLVAAIRRILSGTRDERVLAGLDDEDRVIVQAILHGLQNPALLPPLNAGPEASMAAPGLAALIHSVRKGDVGALQSMSNMAQLMMHSGGDMARLAAIFQPLTTGERDPDKLCKGMSAHGQSLVLAILQELGKLEAH